MTGSSPSTNDATETNQTEAVGNVITENSSNENIEGEAVGKEQEVKIRFTDGTNEVIVLLNESKLSGSMVTQFPFTFDFEAECPKGSLGYFAPWGEPLPVL